jgi:class 3 adenylate cyclase
MGVHTAEATRAGLDYLGIGVNYAARIGAAANGAEILASEATVSSARRSFAESAQRTLHLKGITNPVDVRSIAWR